MAFTVKKGFSKGIHPRTHEWIQTRNPGKELLIHWREILSEYISNFRAALNPHSIFLRKCNYIFLVSSVISVALDPLFFYIPVVNDDMKCLWLDKRLQNAAVILRLITDIIFIVHIVFQFFTGFEVGPSRIYEERQVATDLGAIARRYVSSYFFVDIISILPFPQVVILINLPKMGGSRSLSARNFLIFIVLVQFVPRIVRIYPLYKGVTRIPSIRTETPWTKAAYNLFLYMLASHVLGAFWYFFSIEREIRCWQEACESHGGCIFASFSCSDSTIDAEIIRDLCPIDNPNTKLFDFGIFLDALQSGIVESVDFLQKFFHCFWWGLRNLSSLGQNLETSTYVWENVFAVFISTFGLVLFLYFIGNLQTYLQLETVKSEEIRREMRAKARDVELWMSHCALPESIRKPMKQSVQMKWQEIKNIDVMNLMRILPMDLSRDVKHFIGLPLLRRVLFFEKMDDRLLGVICDCLKPKCYAEEFFISREGEPVDQMLLIIRGRLISNTISEGFSSSYLTAGDHCDLHLLRCGWGQHATSGLPTANTTVQTITKVEAFSLSVNDWKTIVIEFEQELNFDLLRHSYRYGSKNWRTWAACFIQAAWRRYAKKKLWKFIQEEENRLQDALAKSDGPSLGATIYASRFVVNALHALRRNATRTTRFPQRIPPVLLQKPDGPDLLLKKIDKCDDFLLFNLYN